MVCGTSGGTDQRRLRFGFVSSFDCPPRQTLGPSHRSSASGESSRDVCALADAPGGADRGGDSAVDSAGGGGGPGKGPRAEHVRENPGGELFDPQCSNLEPEESGDRKST